jgi:hypothetical protein
VATAAAGCGAGSKATTETVSAYQRQQERAEAEAPKGASPVLLAVYRQFPKPKPDPKIKGSGKAIEKGEKACKGKTPLEVKEEFISQSNLLPAQAEIVAELPKYEKAIAKNAGFAAGQLGALVYEKTLPEDKRAAFGYQGCVYSLAKEVERRLAPGKGG